MRILLDGRDDVFWVEGPTKFEELWYEVQDLCKESGREVRKVVLDGREIPIEKIETVFEIDLNELGLVEIETQGREEVALDSLVQANDLLLSTVETVKMFLEGGSLDYQDVVMSVISAMNTWEKACRGIDWGARQLGVDYTKLSVGSVDFQRHHAKSLDIVDRLTKALSNRDVVSIRDILEYEFIPQVESYSKLIEAIVKTKSQQLQGGEE